MLLRLVVQPGARRNALVDRLAGGEWKLAVTAPPTGGRANEAVLELVSELLGIKQRQVALTRGASSRRKTVEVDGLDAAEAERRLSAALGKGTDGD